MKLKQINDRKEKDGSPNSDNEKDLKQNKQDLRRRLNRFKFKQNQFMYSSDEERYKKKEGMPKVPVVYNEEKHL